MRALWVLVLLGASAAASPRYDLDGDGYDDAVLDHRALYYGSATGLVAATGPSPKQPALFYALEVVGDVNGDGYADVVLGDPACPSHSTDLPACAIGHAYLYLGGPRRLSAKPAQTLTAAATNTSFGMEIIALGDVDGDKLADLAIPDSRGVHIYKGTKTGLSTVAIDLPASRIDSIGDIDKDGKADFVAITPQAATVYYGGNLARKLALPLAPSSQFVGSAAGGDFDGDGYADLAITIETSSPDGKPLANDVLVYPGRATGLATKPQVRITRDHPRAELGAMLVGVGDLDGDKRDDLVIVAACSQFDAKASSCNAGTAYVYLGGPKGLGTTPTAALSPNRSNLGINGNALTGLGDVDKTGHPGFAYGAYVFRGAKGGIASTTPPSL